MLALPRHEAGTLHGLAKEYILPGSTVFTDDYVSYDGLEKHGYVHRRIRHSAKIYVSGDIHTQAIEGFWSLVKRGIGGVYHNVSAKYLQTYLDEYASATIGGIRGICSLGGFWSGFLEGVLIALLTIARNEPRVIGRIFSFVSFLGACFFSFMSLSLALPFGW